MSGYEPKKLLMDCVTAAELSLNCRYYINSSLLMKEAEFLTLQFLFWTYEVIVL